MPLASPSQPTPSLHETYTEWTTALTLPPTSRLSKLRSLLRDPHPALGSIPSARLYLDLSLTYAYLGEYYLASTGFERVVNTGTHSAFALFALGLSLAELCDWPSARLNWKRCLRCFNQIGGTLESIPYRIFQQEPPHNGNRDVSTRNIGLGEQWLLERERVRHNLHRASFETRKGRQELDVEPLGPDAAKLGLNGIPAGLCFGPDGWMNAELERIEAKVFRPLEDIGKPISSRSSPQSLNPSPIMKSLPPLPPRPKAPVSSARPRLSKVWFHASPPPANASAPERSRTDCVSTPSPSMYDSPSSPDRDSIGYHPSISPNSPIPTPVSLCFSDAFSHEGEDEDGNVGFSDIDVEEVIAPWNLAINRHSFAYRDSHRDLDTDEGYAEETEDSRGKVSNNGDQTEASRNLPVNHPIFMNPNGPHSLRSSAHYYDEADNNNNNIEDDTTLLTDFLPGDIGNLEFIPNKGIRQSQNPNNHADTGLELLQPRVFEGFGPRK